MTNPSSQEKKVEEYYSNETGRFYINRWDEDDIHLGLFKDGELIHFYGLIPEHAKIKKRGIQRMTEAVVEPAKITPSDRIVDAGCGIGGTAIYLARKYRCHVSGVNICRHQLDIAAGKVRDAGLTEFIELKYGNCSEYLPFEDCSVDVIVNIESACHYSNRDQFIKECARILKPGGRIAAQDPVMADGITTSNYHQFMEPLMEAWRLSVLETPISYQNLLERNGFEIRELVDLSQGIKPNMDWMHVASQYLDTQNATWTTEEQLWRQQRRTLVAAYNKGYFSIIRYLALNKNYK